MNTRLKFAALLSVIGCFAISSAAKALDIASSNVSKNPLPLLSTGVTAPGGITKVGNDVWISDHLKGFCKLNSNFGGEVIDTTCNTRAVSPGQASYDAKRGFVYVPDNSSKSQGVYRIKVTNGRLSNPVLIGGTSNPLIVNGKGLRANATTLDSDGNLYVGTLKSPNIYRITNPSGIDKRANGTVIPTRFTVVGETSDGGGVTAFTFAKGIVENSDGTLSLNSNLFSDLYVVQDGAISKIVEVKNCTANSLCTAEDVTVNPDMVGPGGIASDGEKLFISDITGQVFQYDIALGEGVSSGTTNPRLTLPTALMYDNNKLYIGDDPTNGGGIAKGHVYVMYEQTAPAVTTANTATSR